jgi:hypothetical protein
MARRQIPTFDTPLGRTRDPTARSATRCDRLPQPSHQRWREGRHDHRGEASVVGEDGAVGSRWLEPCQPAQVPAGEPLLSRDSRLVQRIDHSLPIEFIDGRVDRLVERRDVGECLMGEVVRLEVMPDDLDIIKLGRVFG